MMNKAASGFDRFECGGETALYFSDPARAGFPVRTDRPLLVFLPCSGQGEGASGDIVSPCAESFASHSLQAELQGARILVPVARTASGLIAAVRGFLASHPEETGMRFLIAGGASIPFARSVSDQDPELFGALITAGPDPAGEEKLPVRRFRILGGTDASAAAEDGEDIIVSCGTCDPSEALRTGLMGADGTPLDERFPRGLAGWISEVSRGGSGRGRAYPPHGGVLRTGRVTVADGVELAYEEYGSGDRVILSAQCGFYPRGMQQALAEKGYHVYCITLRGFHPSSLITEDYGDRWYDVFASDAVAFADRMGIGRFSYMGASHGAGVGWHLMLQAQERVDAFIAVVPGPHSLKEGTMSYRQMMEQGLIKSPPPFDPPIDADPVRQARRDDRSRRIAGNPRAFEEERRIDYGRPLMHLKTEERLCEALRGITVPVLILGGYDDPISTPELMLRSARCLRHCKLLIYTNCGHNIDTDLTEELSDEADRFLRNALRCGKWHLPLQGEAAGEQSV